jgi:SAM-dependent methyltransferase
MTSILQLETLKCENICIIDKGYLGKYLLKRLSKYNTELNNTTGGIVTKEYLSNFDVILLNTTENVEDLLENLDKSQVIIFMSSTEVYSKKDSEYTRIEEQIFNSKKNAVVLRVGDILDRLGNIDNIVYGIFKQAMETGEILYYNDNHTFNILELDDLYRSINAILESLKPTFEIHNLVSYNRTTQQLAFDLSNSNVKARKVVCNETDIPDVQTVLVKGDLFESRYNFQFTKDLRGGFKYLHNCIACDNSELSLTLDLGMQILVNDYLDAGEIPDSMFPIHLKRCNKCFHLQLSLSVDPERLFRYYSYKSGVSETMNNYFKEFAEKLPKTTKSVLEIASNDSSQLRAIKEVLPGAILVGVEPATNLVTQEPGIDIINEFFGSFKCMLGLSGYKKFDTIIAQNVFAHIPDPYTFLVNCKEALQPKGTIYIQTSQSEMILKNEFDTLYHEHISFFNVKSMKLLCERAGLLLTDVEKVPVHGCSYLFKIKKLEIPGHIDCMSHWSCEPIPPGTNIDYSSYVNHVNFSVFDLINSEQNSLGLYDPEIYIIYAEKVKEEKLRIKNKLENYYKKGKKVIGYGSTAKINVVLNAVNITSKYINCIIDENPLKIGKYTSFGEIPIVSPDVLQEIDHENVVVLILAWNFKDEILKKIPGKFTTDLL